jgi:hypothetical protein
MGKSIKSIYPPSEIPSLDQLHPSPLNLHQMIIDEFVQVLDVLYPRLIFSENDVFFYPSRLLV